MQFFRPQSGHFAQAQPFAEHGQIRAHVGKVFFAQSSCKSFVDDGLQLLFRQVSHTPPANDWTHPDVPPALDRFPVGAAGGQFQLADPLRIGCFYQHPSIADAVIQPCVRLCIGFTLAGAAGL